MHLYVFVLIIVHHAEPKFSDLHAAPTGREEGTEHIEEGRTKKEPEKSISGQTLSRCLF